MGSVTAEAGGHVGGGGEKGQPQGAPLPEAGWAGVGGEGVGSRRFGWREGLCAD